MDFMVNLPASEPGQPKYLWVIIDRLTKLVTLETMESMDATACAQRFLSCHHRHHGLPRSIVSDRGTNWTSRLWTRLCELAGIKQRLSTAYHPQSDEGPERLKQEIQAYLRCQRERKGLTDSGSAGRARPSREPKQQVSSATAARPQVSHQVVDRSPLTLAGRRRGGRRGRLGGFRHRLR